MRLFTLLLILAFTAACSHPLEIVGEGDILSASGDRDCLLEDFQAGAENCTRNTVSDEYQETYYAQPRPGWKFDHWKNYCKDTDVNQCSFNTPADIVAKHHGKTMAPLRAIFVKDDAPVAECNHSFNADDVYIIDLSPDSEAGGACGILGSNDDIASCVEEKIRAQFSESPACLSAFEVFVPGTNQEHGDYKQFTKIVSSTPGKTYLSLQYAYESTPFDDALEYDKGVDHAENALDHLLDALRSKFNAPAVRVYGHSKGSHAVAKLAQRSIHSDVQFFAFAQPGRTPASYRGTPGYIEKLSDNLVALTWQNDEVKYYTGGDNGKQFPEIWGFPGYVNEEGGGRTVLPLRLDHHNNYGGDYQKKDFPYCAAGNKIAMGSTSECRLQDGVRYVPYFWGDAECASTAYTMMEEASRGDKHYIGNSGPRAGNCKDTVSTVSASYTLKYSINIADQDDCKYHMKLSFNGNDNGTNRSNGGSISLSSTRDTYNRTKTGTVRIPYHMVLNWKASMEDVSGRFSSCVNHLGAKSEGYIHSLKVRFNHPETGRSINRTLIGNSEGIEYIWPSKLAGKNNVAWRKVRGSWDLHFGLPPSYPADALMIKGDTKGGVSGEFYKWVHLVD